MAKKFTIYDFNELFPDDDACLDFVSDLLYPDGVRCRSCKRVTKHHRLKGRKAYSCQECGTHVYPLAGTIFEKSSTRLKSWFYAMYLIASTRCGISAKQLERELGVTYKTAWRIFHQLRSLMADSEWANTYDDEWPLEGTVEVDELHWGGKDKWRHRDKKKSWAGKQPILGMAQRKTKTRPGKIVAKVIPAASEKHILPQVREKVLPRSSVYTDEGLALRNIGRAGYRQERVRHEQGVYVSGQVHANTIEGFWSLLRRGIGGVYHSVSTKHLQSYLDEYTFRYNHREEGDAGMYGALADRLSRVRHGSHGKYHPIA